MAKVITPGSQSGIMITLEKSGPIERPKIFLNDEMKLILNNTMRFDGLENLSFTDGRNWSQRFDANDTSIMREQLTALVSSTVLAWYPDFTARSAFNVVQKGGLGVRVLKYNEKEWTGKARIAGTKTNNAPKTASRAKPNYSGVFNLELDADYTIYDLEAARLGTEPLDADILMRTKFGHEWAFSDLVYGISDDPEAVGYPGLINQTAKLIRHSDDTALNDFNMLSATGVQNRDFLLGIINVPEIFSNNSMAAPTKLIMHIPQAKKISTQVINDQNPETVASYILKNTSITQIIGAPEMKAMTSGSIKDGLLVCNDNTMIGEVIETVPYMIMPPQIDRTVFSMTSRMSSGGLFIYKKAWAFVENCGA